MGFGATMAGFSAERPAVLVGAAHGLVGAKWGQLCFEHPGLLGRVGDHHVGTAPSAIVERVRDFDFGGPTRGGGGSCQVMFQPQMRGGFVNMEPEVMAPFGLAGVVDERYEWASLIVVPDGFHVSRVVHADVGAAATTGALPRDGSVIVHGDAVC
jgi:hypothetical protein